MSATLEADGGHATGQAPVPGGPRHGQDRWFKAVAILAAMALVGFIAYVVVHASPAPTRPEAFPASHPTSLTVGAAAPAFSLARLGGGPVVGLVTAHGEPAMVNFFASWCSNCRAELHSVATVAGHLAGKVAVIGVDTAETSPATAQRLLAAAGATYPVGVDPSGTVATRYKITGLPVTYFISAKGAVVGVAWGAQTERALLGWAAKLTRHRP